MDCYYHTSVPSVATCGDCRQPICPTCRDASGICPGCRLERRIQSAGAARAGIAGGVGPSNPPPKGPPPPPHYGTATVIHQAPTSLANVSSETRALLGLGYPLWPLAAIALLDPKKSPAVRRQSTQALLFNGGMFALSSVLGVLAHLWILAPLVWPAWLIIPFIFPVWLVATVLYGVRTWQGEDVRVPLISDWLDERERAREGVRVTA